MAGHPFGMSRAGRRPLTLAGVSDRAARRGVRDDRTGRSDRRGRGPPGTTPRLSRHAIRSVTPRQFRLLERCRKPPRAGSDRSDRSTVADRRRSARMGRLHRRVRPSGDSGLGSSGRGRDPACGPPGAEPSTDAEDAGWRRRRDPAGRGGHSRKPCSSRSRWRLDRGAVPGSRRGRPCDALAAGMHPAGSALVFLWTRAPQLVDRCVQLTASIPADPVASRPMLVRCTRGVHGRSTLQPGRLERQPCLCRQRMTPKTAYDLGAGAAVVSAAHERRDGGGARARPTGGRGAIQAGARDARARARRRTRRASGSRRSRRAPLRLARPDPPGGGRGPRPRGPCQGGSET